MTQPEIHETAIPGLLTLDLPLHGDNRGWFKENWQRATMVGLGLPDFAPVQNNMSHNVSAGVTRGFHAEPWDKLISVAQGRIFGAWVDLRPGPTFGVSVTREMGPESAVYVPRGVANAYQTLEDGTTYSYLVNDHWSPEARSAYTYLNLADETVAIPWPIPLEEAVLSDADRGHPRLSGVHPMPPRQTVILGGRGQLGRALSALLPEATILDRDDLDLTDPDAVAAYPWSGVGIIINAAAYTAVDAAETAPGLRDAWAVNVAATASLVEVARRHRIVLVHVSSDYVFDGEQSEHSEDEAFTPLSTYGATKAAADTLVSGWPQHYIVRTSWVVGDGPNFVRTMASLAARGVSPSVVDDQFGRLTFASDLADAILHLVRGPAAFGTYNMTNSGPVTTWFDIARDVFRQTGHDPRSVSPTSTADYAQGRSMAPRPRNSTLSLDKIRLTGFTPRNADEALASYLSADASALPDPARSPDR